MTAGRTNVDVFFEKLVIRTQNLQEEEKRGIKEQLNEEELALFDLLMKPRPELTKSEIERVKTAARDLLDTLKAEKLVLDWRKRQQTQAQVQLTVEEKLDAHLPEAYDADMFEQKCNRVYDHIYKNYYGAGQSVYAGAI